MLRFFSLVRMSTLVRVLRVALVVFIAGVPWSEARAEEHRHNVVILVLDTLRADHLGIYGYERPTSPNIDAFAKQATLYRRAEATSPWTLPSHASMFTGLYPNEHGAISYLVTEKKNNTFPLGENHTTLAEVLRDQGYDTAAFAANDAYLSERHGLSQGFDTYNVERERAADRNADALAWLNARSSKKPFFLFINYMDTHQPYDTTPVERLGTHPRLSDVTVLGGLAYYLMAKKNAPPAWLIRIAHLQYDTAIANLDRELGALLQSLDSMGLTEETTVIMVSDHGEFLGEHLLVEHSKDVYEEVIWVPLIVRNPHAQAPSVVETPVSIAHVPALVAESVGGKAGAQIKKRLKTTLPKRLLTENYFSRSKDLLKPEWGNRFHRIRRAVYDWPYKYIQSSDGAHELYDLAKDPTEQTNLVKAKPEIAKRLHADVQDLPDSVEPPKTEAEVSDAEMEALRALGYVE